MIIRAALFHVLLCLVMVSGGRAERLEGAALGTQSVSGEIVEVRLEPQMMVIIRTAAGVGQSLGVSTLGPENLGRVISWLAQTARRNGSETPKLTFSPSRYTFRESDRQAVTRGGTTSAGQSRNYSRTYVQDTHVTHFCTVKNGGAAATRKISVRRIAKMVTLEVTEKEERCVDTVWQGQTVAVGEMKPGEVLKVEFQPVTETHGKKVETSSVTPVEGPEIGQSSRAFLHVKMQVVYLAAFDDAGRILYFTRV